MRNEKKSDKRLSMCIPIYNNLKLFRHCMDAIVAAAQGYENDVEIIISDNASEDNLKKYIDDFKICNEHIRIIYSTNEKNEGFAYNVHKVVELAQGEFCWIIGSDDFVTKDGISSVLKVINDRSEIDFISVNFALLDLLKICDNKNLEDSYNKIPETIDKGTSIRFRTSIKKTEGLKLWDELVDPSYENVMLGSVMAGVFRRKAWISVNTGTMDKTPNFNNAENIYPHCAVYSKCMVGKPAYYLSKPVIIVGDGARDWVGNSFWEGFLPIIHLKVFNEIIDLYEKGGVKKKQIIKCRLYTAKITGVYLAPYLFRRYIKSQNIKGKEYISTIEIIKKSWFLPIFYVGILKGIIKQIIGRE